jgi:mannose-6-phosphate isomerase-like protein (cupin superfamily)
MEPVVERLPPVDISCYRGEFFKIVQGTSLSQIGVMTLQPDQDSGPEETHEGDQIIYVIEGRIDLVIDERNESAKAGTIVTIPAKARHHLYNRADEVAFLLTIYAPPSY